MQENQTRRKNILRKHSKTPSPQLVAQAAALQYRLVAQKRNAQAWRVQTTSPIFWLYKYILFSTRNPRVDWIQSRLDTLLSSLDKRLSRLDWIHSNLDPPNFRNWKKNYYPKFNYTYVNLFVMSFLKKITLSYCNHVFCEKNWWGWTSACPGWTGFSPT